VAVLGWVVFGATIGFPGWWETALYATSSAITLVMVFSIQHTQSRQQTATQRKLDELVRSLPHADNRLIAAESPRMRSSKPWDSSTQQIVNRPFRASAATTWMQQRRAAR